MNSASPIPLAATQPQLDFIESLRKQLHLSEHLLSNHCERIFGCATEDISKYQASRLIEALRGMVNDIGPASWEWPWEVGND